MVMSKLSLSKTYLNIERLKSMAGNHHKFSSSIPIFPGTRTTGIPEFITISQGSNLSNPRHCHRGAASAVVQHRVPAARAAAQRRECGSAGLFSAGDEDRSEEF